MERADKISFNRQTAVKCSVHDLVNGKYILQEGFEPNYVSTKFGRVSRANLMGAVVGIESKSSFVLDDGSGMISVRVFEENIRLPEVGSLINVVGRPRMFNNILYVQPEIVRPVQDSAWVQVRKKELTLRKKNVEVVAEDEKNQAEVGAVSVEKDSAAFTKRDKIIRVISQNDKGRGVPVEDLKSALSGDYSEEEVSSVIKTLLRDGEVYEISPGIIRLL